MTTLKSTTQIFNELNENLDGGTVSVNPGVTVPSKGYVVALKGEGTTTSDFGLEYSNEVFAWIDRAKIVADWNNGFLGVWTDTETDVVYFDVVKVLPEKAAALKLARDTQEIAIFDLANGKEIRA